MQGEVAEEVPRKEEPAITIYSVEDDAVYKELMGKDEQFEEEDEGEGATAQTITKVTHERLMDELRARISEVEAAPVVVSVEAEKVETAAIKPAAVKKTEQDVKNDSELASMLAMMGK